jgi:hypothetical protein
MLLRYRSSAGQQMTAPTDETAPTEQPAPPAAPRVRWRVTVRPAAATAHADRTAGRMAWHLADCTGGLEGHCPEGQRQLAAGGDPDGHCLVDGTCGRCARPALPGQP